MCATAAVGTAAPANRPGTTAVCRLGFRSDGRLTAELGGSVSPRRLTVKAALRTPLAGLVAGHRAVCVGQPGFEVGYDPALATEQFLAAVYELVSVHLIELLAGLPRVALVLGDEVLDQRPIETAHRSDRPALFELTQSFRLPRDSPGGAPRRPWCCGAASRARPATTWPPGGGACNRCRSSG